MIKTNGRQGQGKGGRPKIVGSKSEVNEDEDDLSRTFWLQIMSFSKKNKTLQVGFVCRQVYTKYRLGFGSHYH